MRAVRRQSGGRFPLLPVVRRAEADEGRRVLPSSPADRLRTRAAGFPLPRGTPGGAARTFQRLVGGWGVGPRRGRRLTGSERGYPPRRLPPRSDRAQPGARTARRHSSSQRPLKAPYFRQIRMMRSATACAPSRPTTTARSTCLPRRARRVRHVTEWTPATPLRETAIRCRPSKKRTRRTRFVALAATTRRTRRPAQLPVRGASQVSAAPRTPLIEIRLKVVFGSTDPPGVLTFFASWKSAATILARVFPTRTRGASRGSAKTAMPVAGSYEETSTTTLR